MPIPMKEAALYGFAAAQSLAVFYVALRVECFTLNRGLFPACRIGQPVAFSLHTARSCEVIALKDMDGRFKYREGRSMTKGATMKVNKTLFTMAALGYLTSSSVWANEAQIRHSITQFLQGAHIGRIAKTPYKGIYEAIVDGQLTYTNETGQVIFIGNMIDLKNHRNVAADRQAAIGRDKFAKLPLQDAINIVKGNGARKVAVFEDAKCPYCHQLENSLKSITNVTEYVFLYPIESLHPGTTDLDKRVWCSPNRVAAWTNLMLRNVTPPGALTCQTPIARIQELGKQFDVQGTPTLVFPNGQVVPGAIPTKDLEKALTEFNRK